MQLELIDFLAQIVNEQEAIKQGYSAPTRWLCTNKIHQQKCKKIALAWFEQWKQDELIANKTRDEI